MGLVEPGQILLETDSGDFVGTPGTDTGRSSVLLDDAADLADRGDLGPGDGEIELWAATVGVPHLVLVVEDNRADSADPMTRGRALRHHPAFAPSGTNVNFLSRTGPNVRLRRQSPLMVEVSFVFHGTVGLAQWKGLLEGLELRVPGRQNVDVHALRQDGTGHAPI